MIISSHITGQLHTMLEPHIQKGGVYVDATAGGGRDTLFLASHVGAAGKIYAFDIQGEALVQTRARLLTHEVTASVDLILDSHAKLDAYVKAPIDGMMFNLGYLPGGDPTVVTRGESTCEALDKALALLKKGGFISLLCYTGHPGGMDEYRAVSAYASRLDRHMAQVVEMRWSNSPQSPPVLILIEKSISYPM
ncbi:tRNA (mnm(5)s(2)U34)-methyltransferase [Bianquea renquensis]|uniref:Class I SAM-dependent methyltransferase n=1 Tax=Bianquea renquensis TaxID=2763661 RepID=A0A926I116_9FIRM|nr:class I SAM-dependent methyltransferase [Bianquea renquensis]MBC8543018.1 class I SAM-dependent methyltransferase [Bianquea renquensis]